MRPLIYDIGRQNNITVRDIFDLAHEHANDEDCINASNGKYKPCFVDKVDPSSSRNKDRKSRGDFIANNKKRGGNKQRPGQSNCDEFDKIMNSPCQNHGFPIMHLAKDCNTYK